MNVRLIAHTSGADALVGQAAAICTNSTDWHLARKHALESGHESVAEHAVFTFKIMGVSRALLAQITRHRIASFSVQSQRYVNKDGHFDFIVPPAVSESEEALEEYNK